MTEADSIADIIARHIGGEGPLLPILHGIQAEHGHIGEAAMRDVALALNLSRAEVYGVVSFYHDFRTSPETRPVIKLCRAEACQSRGSEALAAAAAEMGGGRVVFEPVYCLGLCAVGPAALIGGQVHARLDAARLVALADAL